MYQKNHLTIVMYHYVRELADSRYPEIKGLSVENFKNQLDYFAKHYTFIRMEDCLHSLKYHKPLPEKALLLTFDDGYIDHFLHVFPILSERNIQGSFFPPAKTIMENCLLDVNKIHHILAAVTNKQLLLEEVYRLINVYRHHYSLKTPQDYASSIQDTSRYDTKEVVFIKCLLQRDLPYPARTQITNDLFSKYIQINERVFSKELYMDIKQIKLMKHYGMFIGSHSYDHVWMNTLSEEEQEHEVIKSCDFLHELNIDTKNWVMCYPYGEYNESLIHILKKHHCQLGLTTRVDIANLIPEHAFTLPRLDTNDFPVTENHPH